MDLTLSCMGITTAINMHRTHAGSHLVRIPNTAPVLDLLTSSLWTSSAEDAARLAGTFHKPDFWRGEDGYEFTRRNLEPLLVNGRPRLLDVGCSVGQLVTFLKDTQLWDQLDYVGTDADSEAVRVASEKYSDVKFEVSDAQQPLHKHLGVHELVYTKGTICSTYRPFDALAAILKCASDSAFLVHTACTTNDCGSDGFVTTMYASKDNAYVFTIMNINHLQQQIRECGFDIAVQTVRKRSKNVLNLGTYRLYDFVLHRADKRQLSEGGEV